MRHELRLVARGLLTLAVAAPVVVLAAGLWAGAAGVASALAGMGIIAANQLAAAASTGWARTVSRPALAVGYAMFVLRMFGVFSVLVVLTAVPWVHRPALAAAFCVALAVSLGAEWRSYVRRSYVPSWRLGVTR